MNYIRHLNAFFFQHLKRDKRFNANHVSLYIALFQFWNFNRFQNPFSIFREEVMSITGIGSRNTYHKCIKDLHEFGYIFYRPSLNKFQKSEVHIVRLDNPKAQASMRQLNLFEMECTPGSQVMNVPELKPSVPKSVQVTTNTVSVSDPFLIPARSQNCDPCSHIFDTDTVLYLELLIKHKLNSKLEREENEKNSLTQKIFSKNNFLQKCINEMGAVPKSVQDIPSSFSEVPLQVVKPMSRPNIFQVISFFEKHEYPVAEAKKFFNHYQSNGWLIAGKTPMQDWESSAHKWMLNVDNFKQGAVQSTKNAGTANEFSNNKNFSEPL
jgi:hypothetical protein